MQDIRIENILNSLSKSNLPEKSYFKAWQVAVQEDHINTAKQIFKDKINKSKVDLEITEFENFCKPRDKWGAMGKNLLNGMIYITEIYDMLKKF